MEGNVHDTLLILAVMTIPALAIAGGIVHGIVRTVCRQRRAELAQRERIAAIQQGIDPRSLPPVYADGEPHEEIGILFEQAQLRRAQGLKIGGVICIAAGLGIGIPLVLLGEPQGYVPGFVMVLLGIGLLISARFVVTNGQRGGGDRLGR